MSNFFNPLVMKDEEVKQIVALQEARAPRLIDPETGDPILQEPVAYKAIQDYKEHFKNILENLNANIYGPIMPTGDAAIDAMNIDPYADYTTADARAVANMQYAFRDNPEMLAQFATWEKEAFFEVQDKVAEQASSRDGLHPQLFIQEFAEKHEIEVPMHEWKKASELAYINETKELIEQNNGALTSPILYQVTNLMDAIDIETIEQHIDLKDFWYQMGKDFGKTMLESGESRMAYELGFDAMRQVRYEMKWEEYKDIIADNVTRGKIEVMSQAPEQWAQAIGAEIERSKWETGITADLINDVVEMMENVPSDIAQSQTMAIVDMFRECGRVAEWEKNEMHFELANALENAQQNPQFGQFITECVNQGRAIAQQEQNIQPDTPTLEEDELILD